MRAKDLLNYMIPPLKPGDAVEKAITWMKELRLTQLPVVDKGNYLGIFSEDVLLDADHGSVKIDSIPLIATSVWTDQNEHYYELLKKTDEEDIGIIAVLDQDKKYLGVVSIEDVVEAFSRMSSIKSPGTIIILAMTQVDYSMAEISRIVESEYAKILSSFIENSLDDPNQITVTIKLNLQNASNVISALRRHDYTILSKFGNDDNEEDVEKERLDSLMKYLRI